MHPDLHIARTAVGECKIRNDYTDLQPQIKSLRFDGKVGNRYDRDRNFI